MLGLGLVALVVFGGFLLQALSGGGGGSDSAEGAVRELADAVSSEDLLGALAVIAPGEVGSLDRAVSSVFRKAEEYEIVDSAARPFAGFDLNVHDLALDSEEMAPGFVKVSITSGRIDAGTHPEQFAELIRGRGGMEPASTSIDLGDVLCEEGCPGGIDHPFLMAVEDGGRWYVSAAYTAFEYWRLSEGLPEPDLGSARALAAGGDESPEAAVEAMFEAATTLDMERLGSLVLPEELGAAYDYRAAITAAIDEQDDIPSPLFEIDDLELKATRNGNTADVTIEAGTLRFGNPGEPGETTVQFSGDGCMQITSRYESFTETFVDEASAELTIDDEAALELWSYDSGAAAEGWVPAGEEFPGDFEEVLGDEEAAMLEELGIDFSGEDGVDEMTIDTCEEGGPFMPPPLSVGSGPVPSGIRTVERDGRWYVTLVGSLVDGAEKTTEMFDRRSVYMMFGLAHRIEPDGAVAIGEAVEGELASFADFDVWTLQGRAGEEIVLRVGSEDAGDLPFSAGGSFAFPALYGPDGEEVWGTYAGEAPLFSLPEDGEYRIVVQGSGDYTLRVEQADVPALPVPGSVSGTLDGFGSEGFLGDPFQDAPVYAVDVPEGTRVAIRSEPGPERLWVNAQPAATPSDEGAFVEYVEESFGAGSGTSNATILDSDVATRWYLTVMPGFDESMFGGPFGPDGEPIGEPSTGPIEFTLTAEVVDGG